MQIRPRPVLLAPPSPIFSANNASKTSLPHIHISTLPSISAFMAQRSKGVMGIGMMRYSMAQCMPLGQVEDYCRDDNPPENRTLYYPNGDPVEVTDIYTHVCPCDEGLQCVDNFCAADDSYENNYLY
ncbi:hypothetical protein AVEN_87837-1 [Araneus ventricosus]|uniref:Uncharacterized protein n=1 Tax=Araneus ventricosus TaxID=182803 RepID=A0A4Y2BBS7_ARAVE|nr:hypothetical protein AVEN_87837-1 [Araneus ventricosus]